MKKIALALLVAIAVASLPELEALEAQSFDPESLSRAGLIRRDSYGVPHIKAKTEEAAAFALGYAQAEDHGMEIARRFVNGRGESAKHFGAGAESDFLIKQFDNIAASREGVKQLGDLYRRVLTAYVAGVNRWMAKRGGDLPAWVPAFEPADVLAHARANAIGAVAGPGAIRALREKYAGEAPRAPSAPGAEGDESKDDSDGSNAFALHGSRTASGRPILLGNPHLNWASLYWEAHVTVPGKLDFYGSTLAGIPVLRAGFNERLGWVTTNNRPDLDDYYALKLDPLAPDHYLFEGVSRPLVRKEIEVEIRGADGALRTERRVCWESHLGPVVYRTPELAFAVRSTALDAFRHFEGFYLLSRTRRLRDWLAVMRENLLSTSNFTYADADGNILYLWNGRVPKRVEDGTKYDLDVPGEMGKYVWQGMHALSELPQLLNPPGGYIQNCNNPPWFTSLRDPLDASRYPSYFERGELSLRPQLALEMLESQPKFTFEDVRRMKYNTKMLLAARVRPDLIAALRTVADPSEDLIKGLAALEAWDGEVAATSRGAVLFQKFWDLHRAEVKNPFAVAWDPARPAATPSGLADPVTAVKNFAEAARWTREQYGAIDVAWGEVHRFRFKDVDLPADGAGGAYGMFRVQGFSEQPGNRRVAGWIGEGKPLVGFGDAWVLAVEFTRRVSAYSILAYGQTTDPASPHSRDQIHLFARRSYKPVWFRESEIKSHLEREYRP